MRVKGGLEGGRGPMRINEGGLWPPKGNKGYWGSTTGDEGEIRVHNGGTRANDHEGQQGGSSANK